MWSGCIWKLVSPWVPNTCKALQSTISIRAGRVWEGGGAKAGHMCKNSWQHKEKLPRNLQMEKKGICRGHGLFSPEAVIYLGQNPTLNHCVCFYGLSGFVCAPQPLKAVWGAADFGPNLGIVKPHRFLALEECLASPFWLLQRTRARRLIGSMQMSWGCVFVFVSLWWAGGGNSGCSHRFSTFSLTLSAAASVGCERSSRRLWISVYWIQFYFE